MASSKQDGNEWAWVVDAAQQPRLCGLSARARSRVTVRKMLLQFSELVFVALERHICAAFAKV